MNEVVRNQVKISAFRYILPDKFVCVFYCSLLPRGVGVSKIHLCIQCVGYSAVVAELRAVVSGYRAHVFPVRQKDLWRPPMDGRGCSPCQVCCEPLFCVAP